ncbi:hypothetical protein ACFE04_025071 [Oxalis oulophora]
MNGKKGSSATIDIPPLSTKPKQAEKNGNELGVSSKEWIKSVWEFCKEDSNRVKFSFKVGLAVLLVSLLILFQAPYDVFGSSIIWSILTVAIMFEYTVGSTFNRGFNRALGSLLAGVLAIGVAQLALQSGRVIEPFIIGISIFLVVNVLVFPIWAGEQLHKDLVVNFNSLADSLQECVKKYLDDDGSDHPEFSKTVMDDFPDEPCYKKCKATMNSSAKLESLANSAKWEPPHGRFRHFFYPWSEYVKVGAVLRYCAYEVMALHGVLHSEIQAPYNLRIAFQREILEASSDAAELVRSLGKDIGNMQQSLKTTLLKRVHNSTDRLQRAIDLHSYLLTTHSDAPGPDSAKPLTRLSNTLSSNLSNELTDNDETNLNEQSQAPVDSYHEMMRKQSRRLYSWPSREVDAFEEEGGLGVDFLPRMNALESTAALSLATFTSLLIEFVARLDHLVEAVDKLSNMAKFKHEGL